jgi:alpha-L-rhamnosidase
MMIRLRYVAVAVLMLCTTARVSLAQDSFPDGKLDPTRHISTAETATPPHVPLPEQYIWTAGDAAALHADHNNYGFAKQDAKSAPHYFRYAFQIAAVPAAATLYLAGPRSAKIYVNGKLVDRVASDVSSPLGIHVFTTDIRSALQSGANTLALEIVRGRGIVSVTNSRIVQQQTFGEILVAKILPAAPGIDAPPLAISGPDWKSSLEAPSGWEQPGFDDSTWKAVQSLGPIESSVDMFQWNGDAGMFDWPGYEGVSPFLRQYRMKAEKVTDVFEGRSEFQNLQALTSAGTSQEFEVTLSQPMLPDEIASSLILDFGREVEGRVEFQSDCDCDAWVTIQYGESAEEAKAGGHFVGTDLLRIAGHSTAYGPKAGFRYAKIRFVGGGPEIKFKTIQLDGIYYPVEYKGSFESSDPLLNRIWETGAYTMHLCMQDDIWDAVKRDRGRWIGDLDVGGRVVNSVFADHFLVEDTMTRLIGESPVTEQVNTIPGYSALWVTAVAEYYRHTGAKDFLASVHARLVELLKLMDSGFDDRNVFVNPGKQWLFVDWSPGLFADTPEARQATQIEYYRAYKEGAYLLRELNDNAAADHYEQRADAIRAATNQYLRDAKTETYGPRWQTNAMAIVSGLATPEQYPALWDNVLKNVAQDRPDSPVISPYYNYYVVSAMAQAGHRAEALQWIRTYWGGMLAEGATSFWEAYDLRWPKTNSHVSLQADGTTGYFVSLAHGWSSGPTAWLMEQVLGINPTSSGFGNVTIRPDLIDLSWARGAEPTPSGPIKVDIKNDGTFRLALDLPPSVDADVLVPIANAKSSVYVNGMVVSSTLAEGGARAEIHLSQAGHYDIHAE